jgi:hypothetical protein
MFPFAYLRILLSHDTLAINPEYLEKVPVLMTSMLPQFEYEKNAELDEMGDDIQPIKTATDIKPFEHNRNDTENDSFNDDFKIEPEVLLYNFNQFLISLRWTKNHPKNFKEWFLSIVND